MNYREEIRFTIENSFKLEYNNKKKNVFRGMEDMITLFLSPSCTSCRKARAWLTSHEVPLLSTIL